MFLTDGHPFRTKAPPVACLHWWVGRFYTSTRQSKTTPVVLSSPLFRVIRPQPEAFPCCLWVYVVPPPLFPGSMLCPRLSFGFHVLAPEIYTRCHVTSLLWFSYDRFSLSPLRTSRTLAIGLFALFFACFILLFLSFSSISYAPYIAITSQSFNTPCDFSFLLCHPLFLLFLLCFS